jgi:spore germination cell wall hydrolase CwlJ-like protein
LLSNIGARADSRALFGAVVFGSAMGAVLGVAYLAGGATRAAVDHAQAARLAASVRMTVGEPSAVSTDQLARLTGGPAPELRGALPQPTAADLPLRLATDKHIAHKRELDCLTDAVYYEARGEGASGQAAVAQVVLNRVRHKGFPKTICGVVYQGVDTHECQFSFACDGSTRRALEPAAWRHSRSVAARALGGFVMEEVGNATHFHVASLGGVWGAGLMRVAQVGAHVFYKFSGHPAVQQAAQTPPKSDQASPAFPSHNEASSPELILASAVATTAQAAEAPKPSAPPAKEPAAEPAKAAAPAQKEAVAEPAKASS